ncbi:hypothetical protein Tco_0326928 [Tanacetum coccineum]
MSYLVPLIAVVFVVVVGCYLACVPQEEDHQYIIVILGLIVPLVIVAIGVEELFVVRYLLQRVSIPNLYVPPVERHIFGEFDVSEQLPSEKEVHLVKMAKMEDHFSFEMVQVIGLPERFDESSLLRMECPVAASCSGELSGMFVLQKCLRHSRIHPAYDRIGFLLLISIFGAEITLWVPSYF